MKNILQFRQSYITQIDIFNVILQMMKDKLRYRGTLMIIKLCYDIIY